MINIIRMRSTNYLKYILFLLFVVGSVRGYAQTEISELWELYYYSKLDSVDIKVKPGKYYITKEITGEGTL